jgi:DNA-binding MarR family transcriptional regulator
MEADDLSTEKLKLKNQICFPLYACARGVIRAYKPILKKIGLTYTQYIVMLVLWEKKSINVKQLGEELCLETGTLTPLLRRLESAGLVTRSRGLRDERNLMIGLTAEGEALERRAENIPDEIYACVSLDSRDASELYRLLYLVLGRLRGGAQGEE